MRTDPANRTPRAKNGPFWDRPGRLLGPLWAALLLAAASARFAPGLAWGIDLAANLAAHLAALAALSAAWWAFRRRWALSTLAAAAAALAWTALLTSRAPLAPGRPPAPATIRIMVYNAHSFNRDPERAFRTIMDSQADVIALSEPTSELLDLLRSPDARAKYPHAWLPDEARGGWRVLLSRWPQRWEGPDVHGGEGSRGRILDGATWITTIERPGGPFIFVHLHPNSPRSPRRWREGTRHLQLALHTIEQQARPLNLPIVMAGDLNATPTGLRSRMIDRQGLLQRCKPLAAGGTFPAWLPAPLRIAIDDVWISPDIRLHSWARGDSGGSDHLPVTVELAMPITPPAAEAAPP